MLRNKEVKQFVAVFSAMSIVSVIVGFRINSAAGILALVMAIIYGIICALFTKARYDRIAEISDQIDLVLHNAEHLYIAQSEEGELSILQSEITKMTQRIREQNEALRKEKEHLADSMADIAHQLRTPLTSVNLILSLLEENPYEEQRKSLIRETKELFGKMDWLLTSLLKLSRLDAGIVVFQKEQIDINRLVNASLRPLLIPLDLHNVSVKFEVPKGIEMKGDFGWLTEAIQNIIKNCMESAGENGKIDIIGTDNVLYTEICIHDNGKGFEKEDLPCLFHRFYRGKNSQATGYGIGLALCKMIITRQGGTITAKNHPHGGALFVIRFPK